jgi:uncharacterized protein (DUF1778 family)
MEAVINREVQRNVRLRSDEDELLETASLLGRTRPSTFIREATLKEARRVVQKAGRQADTGNGGQ